MSHPLSTTSEALIDAAEVLRRGVDRLSFAAPVTHVYNPLDYARAPYARYVERFGAQKKRIVLLGMNPGPFGMAQTGIPFGEVRSVDEWMQLRAEVLHPDQEHPKRIVEGFACRRSEVSGARLWGGVRARFPDAGAFFAEHFVINYCPLLFLEASGKNRTPDKLPATERAPLEALCDAHLVRVVDALEPEWVLGVGLFAEKRARLILGVRGPRIGVILHPSPQSPAANRDWVGTVRAQLAAYGIESFV